MDPRALSRRSLLAAGMSAILPGQPRSATIRLGCQTNAWPINPQQPDTLYKSLREIHYIGFTGFETGFRNVLPLAGNPALLKTNEAGLTFFGVHIFLAEYDPQTGIAPAKLALQVAKAGADMGAERLIVSGSPQGNARKKADALNSLAAQVKPQGLKLAYHNHGPEFKGAEPEIEMLLAGTDPGSVWFVLDAGHAFRAGADLPGFISRHADRLTGVHLRDFKDGQQVPLGQGSFPLREVAKALQDKNWNGWALAEEEREDGSKLAGSAAGPAYSALTKAFGAQS